MIAFGPCCVVAETSSQFNAQAVCMYAAAYQSAVSMHGALVCVDNAQPQLHSMHLLIVLLQMQLQKEKGAVEQQFNQLYHDKYQPLKENHKAVIAGNQQLQEQQRQAQEQVEKLRTQLATADLKLRKSGLEVQALSQQLQQSQSSLEVGAII